MTNVNWTKPGRGWKKGGIAAALASLAIVGSLAVGSGVYAQTTNPPTSTLPSTTQQGTRPQRGGHGGGAHLAAAAKALGIDEAALKTELQAGKTIADVAKAKNIALSLVSDAILADEKAELAQAVTDGKLTQAQADAKLATAPTRITEMLNGTMPVGGKGERGGHGGPGLAVAAKALGMDEAALKTELQAGKTIADVAKAKSIDLSVVSNALLEAEKTRLAQAVTDGKLTQAEADAKLATAQTRITDMLNGKLPVGGPGKHGPKLNGAAKPTTSPLPTALPGA
jgi:hypothetical protein